MPDLSVVILWTAVIGGLVGIAIVLFKDLLGKAFSWIETVELDDDEWDE